tara:strand:- start:1250 stop:1471 length:222 start_codon:yes stop_codon:yes gene_type:complete
VKEDYDWSPELNMRHSAAVTALQDFAYYTVKHDEYETLTRYTPAYIRGDAHNLGERLLEVLENKELYFGMERD